MLWQPEQGPHGHGGSKAHPGSKNSRKPWQGNIIFSISLCDLAFTSSGYQPCNCCEMSVVFWRNLQGQSVEHHPCRPKTQLWRPLRREFHLEQMKTALESSSAGASAVTGCFAPVSIKIKDSKPLPPPHWRIRRRIHLHHICRPWTGLLPHIPPLSNLWGQGASLAAFALFEKPEAKPQRLLLSKVCKNYISLQISSQHAWDWYPQEAH